jgi:hypothetical protein
MILLSILVFARTVLDDFLELENHVLEAARAMDTKRLTSRWVRQQLRWWRQLRPL